MIRKVKWKFILLSIAPLFALQTCIIVSVNLFHIRAVTNQADMTLSFLSQAESTLLRREEGQGGWLPPGMSNIPWDAHFFSVRVDGQGDVIDMHLGALAGVNEIEANQYAKTAVNRRKDSGFIDHYRYHRAQEIGVVRITFLDCTDMLGQVSGFARFSVGVSLLAFFVIALIVCFFAGRFIRPVSESYEKQRQFITDAGHEIKTPLTIIGAYVDVLRMDIGENEYLNNITQQVKRLTALTNDLIALSRMEEPEKRTRMIDFPVSEVILDAAKPFATLALNRQMTLSCHVQPLLTMRGNSGMIAQLISILLDNALKYTPENGAITLDFCRQGRKLILTVCNPSATPIQQEALRHVFERFYRMDPSRNSQTGGFGIGLALAKNIVSAHGGKIAASAADGHTFTITATFPATQTKNHHAAI